MAKQKKAAKAKPKPEQQKNPAGQKLNKEFVFNLAQAEIAKMASEAANIDAERIEREVERATKNKEMLAGIQDLESKRATLLAKIREKKEARVVEVTQVMNYDAKLVQYWYQGKVLEERTMTADELQAELPLKTKKKREKEPTGAQKTYAKAKGAPVAESKANGKDHDIQSTIRAETGRRTKRSSVDGVYGNA